MPGGTLSALGGLLIVLGSGLPWYTGIAWGTPYITYGIDQHKGILTLALGILTILLGVSHLTAPRLPTLLERSSIVIGIVTGVVVIYDCLDFTGLLGLLLGRYGDRP